MTCFTNSRSLSTPKRWQTSKIVNNPHSIDRLAEVVAAIDAHFINLPGEWDRRVNDGSVTFQHGTHPGQVITVFIDDGCRLSTQCGLTLFPEPIVVAIELSHSPCYVAHLVREDLSSRFGRLYMDPRAGGSRYYLSPNTDHHFDILFVDQGECPFHVCGNVVKATADWIRGEIASAALD